jgi:magnesium chelatase subunit D
VTDEAARARDAWADAKLALELFCVAPRALGGIVLRAPPGPQREQLCAWLAQLVVPGAPQLKLPLHITDDRLLGGLSLTASLRLGRPVQERGVLAEADGGVIVVPMAERLERHVTAQLCAALDRGELALERDGISSVVRCRFGVVALDEGVGDECAPAPLRDRLAFHLDLSELAPGIAMPERRRWDAPSELVPTAESERLAHARALWPRTTLPDALLGALCEAADSLGVASLRAPLLAAHAARALAALAGRTQAEEDDALSAARLVLGPRATRLPAELRALEAEPAPPAPPAPPAEEQAAEPEQVAPRDPALLEELVVAAAKSGIPADVLELLQAGHEPRLARRSEGRAGTLRSASGGGRPAGVRAAVPSGAERLNVVETLRAAAPWQRLRASERPSGQRVAVRKQDLRITRYQKRSETTVIFCVDASGSAALQRLAEAKGAVEQVLIDCYARRDHVALLAFRDRSASLLLPPTRSLTRVRRSLAQLAGGGTTPLAAGIDAALELALSARKRGSFPIVVLMTDARGNVARDGAQGLAAGTQDALASARALRVASITSLFLDTAPRPGAQAQRLAAELGARYMALPYLDAAGISEQVQALARTS